MKTPNYGRILDTRDLDTRKEELESLRDALEQARADREAIESSPSSAQWEIDRATEVVEELLLAFGDDEAKELADLENAESEVPEWRHGNTLVPRDEWVEYVKELLADIGDLPKNLPRYIEIDWDKTADNIKADYSEIEIQGTTYLYRNC